MRQRAKNQMIAKGYLEISIDEWTDLRTKVGVMESDMEQIKDNHLPHIYKELKAIREKVNEYRPPWTVVAIITFLTSVCVALIVHLRF